MSSIKKIKNNLPREYMKAVNEHMKDLIPDYLDGNLNAKDHAKVVAHIADSKEFANEVVQYKKLIEAFNKEPMVMPSKKITEGFEKMLAEEKENKVKVVSIQESTNKSWLQKFSRVAASIALLIGVFFAGKYTQQNQTKTQIVSLQNEAQEYKEVALISLLENESASKRIQGVQLVQDFDTPDSEIVNALGQKMLNDENTNVRLTALEALSSFSYSEQVKNLFIEALKTEKNPSIQVAIIEVLVQLQEKKAIGPMKDLLEKEETQPFIKDQINLAIPKII